MVLAMRRGQTSIFSQKTQMWPLLWKRSRVDDIVQGMSIRSYVVARVVCGARSGFTVCRLLAKLPLAMVPLNVPWVSMIHLYRNIAISFTFPY